MAGTATNVKAAREKAARKWAEEGGLKYTVGGGKPRYSTPLSSSISPIFRPKDSDLETAFQNKSSQAGSRPGSGGRDPRPGTTGASAKPSGQRRQSIPPAGMSAAQRQTIARQQAMKTQLAQMSRPVARPAAQAPRPTVRPSAQPSPRATQAQAGMARGAASMAAAMRRR